MCYYFQVVLWLPTETSSKEVSLARKAILKTALFEQSLKEGSITVSIGRWVPIAEDLRESVIQGSYSDQDFDTTFKGHILAIQKSELELANNHEEVKD